MQYLQTYIKTAFFFFAENLTECPVFYLASLPEVVIQTLFFFEVIFHCESEGQGLTSSHGNQGKHVVPLHIPRAAKALTDKGLRFSTKTLNPQRFIQARSGSFEFIHKNCI